MCLAVGRWVAPYDDCRLSFTSYSNVVVRKDHNKPQKKTYSLKTGSCPSALCPIHIEKSTQMLEANRGISWETGAMTLRGRCDLTLIVVDASALEDDAWGGTTGDVSVSESEPSPYPARPVFQYEWLEWLLKLLVA